jgi:hypothetical protein
MFVFHVDDSLPTPTKLLHEVFKFEAAPSEPNRTQNPWYANVRASTLASVRGAVELLAWRFIEGGVAKAL